VLVSLSLWEADQFGQAVASAAHTDATERAEHAELIRLGRVLGFATESGTVALTYAAGQLDARNVADRATLRQGFDLANQLPASLLPAGGVASILKSPIQEAILAIYGDAHRVDNAEHVAVARSSALEEARTLAEACASKQVQSHAAQAALRYDQAGHLLMSEELRNAVDTGSKMVSQTGPVPMAAP
jgi:hypothetical protein